MYEDASFWVNPGETKKESIKYVDDYNSENAEIGSTVAYKNPLNFDSDTYNTYVNSVINSDRGTLVITPTSGRTRIYLNPGDKVIINAGGSVRLGMFAGYGGPNGIEGFSSYSTTSNAKHGSLIYAHPSIDGWRFVGSNNTIMVNKSGLLKLTVNDNSTDDDEGQFIVNYEIIRPTVKEQSTNQPYNSNKAGGWQTLFNGKNLDGWQIAENPASFSVQDGAIVVSGPRAHLFYDGPIGNHNFKNFEWKATVKTMPRASSGMFIHTDYQDEGWPNKGYRIQVNQTHADWRKTGSVYAVQDVKELFVKDEEWYTVSITVKDEQVTIRVNDKVVNNYIEPDSISTGTSPKKLSNGTVALQCHDPKSMVFYKDVMLRILPD